MGGARTLLAIAVCAALGADPARAQPDRLEPVEEASLAPARPTPLGPLIYIESIEVVGNDYTAERLIRRALPVKEGDSLRAGDPRLSAARFKVLALGYFREVDLRLRKGHGRGRVVLSVRVVERGTVVLNRIFFGNSLLTPWWFGFDLTERNFFGSGVGVGGALVLSGEGRASGARRQRGFQLRLEDPSVFGSAIGVHGTLEYIRGSEPFRISGQPQDGGAEHFAAFDYRRIGGRGGVTVNLTALARLSALVRFEAVHADLPAAPSQTFPDGTVAPLDLLLEDGASRVVTGGVLFERDSRPDPILPYAGDHLLVLAEGGAEALGSSYQFASLLARYGRWWTVAPGHVVSMHITGGAILGDAPRFDRLHVADLNRMLTPRALGLVMSASPPLDLFGTGADEITYGELGGVAEAQYARRLFRRQKLIYGGDLFLGVGLWTLHRTGDVPGGAPTLPIDLLLDAGLRLDTEIGVFELSLTNALGRVPL
jgi:hypothetical protein